MEAMIAYAIGILKVLFSLPIITQWAVIMLLISGVIVHLLTYGERAVHDGPSIFTTAGIFFTFLGIAEGLYGFDPQKIDASIPLLLDGLKTAFIASVVGVGIALTIKLRYALFGLRTAPDAQRSDGATVDDLVDRLAAVQQALVGNEDSTLLTQIKLSRQDTNDRLDALQRSQAGFMQRLADGNSKALIAALQEVIRDFNTKITDQFGDNFKHLNEAVGALLEWQENYRQQVAEMVKHQAATSDNMAIATSRYSDLVGKAEAFGVLADQLADVLRGLEAQRAQIGESLKSLGQLLTAASDGLPKIETKIVELTEQVTYGVKQNQDEMTKTLRDNTVALQASVADVSALLLETTQASNQQVSDHLRQLADKTTEQLLKLTEQVTYGVKQNQDEMTKTLRDNAVALQASIADVRALLLDTTQSFVRQNTAMRSLKCALRDILRVCGEVCRQSKHTMRTCGSLRTERGRSLPTFLTYPSCEMMGRYAGS